MTARPQCPAAGSDQSVMFIQLTVSSFDVSVHAKGQANRQKSTLKL